MDKILPSVSVVIPTINRGGLLVETLSETLKSDYRDFEVVVIDQTEDPDKSLLDFIERHRKKINYIKIEEPGLPNARNVGIRNAKGDVILFIDDDVIPGKSLISAHAGAYTDKKNGGVAGRILPPGGGSGELEQNPEKIAKIKLMGLLFYDNFDSDVSAIAHHARGCNMSFLKKALIDLGGFDTRFGGSAHLEETDMSVRVRNSGYEMVFVPEASLIHLLEPVGGCRPKNIKDWFFWYGHNLCLFYRKNYPTYLFPLYCIFFALKIPLSAVKRGDVRIIYWGIRGFFTGFSQNRREFTKSG